MGLSRGRRSGYNKTIRTRAKTKAHVHIWDTGSTLNTTPDHTQQCSSLYTTILTSVGNTLSCATFLSDYTLHWHKHICTFHIYNASILSKRHDVLKKREYWIVWVFVTGAYFILSGRMWHPKICAHFGYCDFGRKSLFSTYCFAFYIYFMSNVLGSWKMSSENHCLLLGEIGTLILKMSWGLIQRSSVALAPALSQLLGIRCDTDTLAPVSSIFSCFYRTFWSVNTALCV